MSSKTFFFLMGPIRSMWISSSNLEVEPTWDSMWDVSTCLPSCTLSSSPLILETLLIAFATMVSLRLLCLHVPFVCARGY